MAQISGDSNGGFLLCTVPFRSQVIGAAGKALEFVKENYKVS